jgi:hypothetical protein
MLFLITVRLVQTKTCGRALTLSDPGATRLKRQTSLRAPCGYVPPLQALPPPLLPQFSRCHVFPAAPSVCLSLQVATDLGLDGVVVIGGDDSNTNAAFLAEYFAAHGSPIRVIGCVARIPVRGLNACRQHVWHSPACSAGKAYRLKPCCAVICPSRRVRPSLLRAPADARRRLTGTSRTRTSPCLSGSIPPARRTRN